MILENVKALCKAKGISVRRLERDLGLGNGVIGKWENRNPRIDTLKKVADYLEVTVDQLIVTKKGGKYHET